MIKKIADFLYNSSKKMSFTEYSFFKACVFAAGVLFGLVLPQKSKKTAKAVSAFVFLATYIPLMVRLVEIFNKDGFYLCGDCRRDPELSIFEPDDER